MRGMIFAYLLACSVPAQAAETGTRVKPEPRGAQNAEKSLPESRCLWTRTQGPVPGLLTHRIEDIDLLSPIKELVLEFKLLDKENVWESDVNGFVYSDNHQQCLLYGKSLKWSECDIKLAQRFDDSDRLIMDTMSSSGGASRVCVSEFVINTDSLCEQNLKNMKNEGVILAQGYKENALQGVYMTGSGTISSTFDIGSVQEEDGIKRRYICNGTAISRAYFGLVQAIKQTISEYSKLAEAINFKNEKWGIVPIIENCPDILANAIYSVYDIRTDIEKIKEICPKIWIESKQKRSLLSYIFSNDYRTINDLMKSSNTNLKNIRLLGGEIKGIFHWKNHFEHQLTLLDKSLKNEIVSIKKSLILQVNYDNLRRYSDLLEARKERKYELLFAIFNRCEALISEGKRRFDKILSRLSAYSPCSIDVNQEISCPQGSGIVEFKDGITQLINRAKKFEIKEVSLATCLYWDNGNIFQFNGNLFVKDTKFYHNPKVSIPLNCTTLVKDPNYDCSDYYTGEKGVKPDQIMEDVYYILTPKGVYFQNLGPPTKLYFGSNRQSFVITKEPFWVHKDEFPIQLSGSKDYSFESLKSVSQETNLNFRILVKNRDKDFDYGKFRELHKSAIKKIGFQKIYGSFHELFKNNVTVRVVSIGGSLATLMVSVCALIIMCYCCSKSSAGHRRYSKYYRRPFPPAASAPAHPPSAPRAPASPPPGVSVRDETRRPRTSRRESASRERIRNIFSRL